MALEIDDLRKQKRGAMYVSPARLYVSADDELCDGADPAVVPVTLLVGEGCEIPNAVAAKYGLIAGAEPEAEEDEEPEAEDLADSTVPELRELADERGVELPARANKADIIAALEEAEGNEENED